MKKKVLTPKQKEERKQYIKKQIFKALHFIGYVCIFLVALFSILMGVQNCNKKTNNSSSNNIQLNTHQRLNDFNINAWYDLTSSINSCEILRNTQIGLNIEYAYNLFSNLDYNDSNYQSITLTILNYDTTKDIISVWDKNGSFLNSYNQLYLSYYYNTGNWNEGTLVLSGGGTSYLMVYNPNESTNYNYFDLYSIYLGNAITNIGFKLNYKGNLIYDYSLLQPPYYWVGGNNWNLSINDIFYNTFPLKYTDYYLPTSVNLWDLFGVALFKTGDSHIDTNTGGVPFFKWTHQADVNDYPSYLIGYGIDQLSYNSNSLIPFKIGNLVSNRLKVYSQSVDGKNFKYLVPTFNTGNTYYFIDSLQAYDYNVSDFVNLISINTEINSTGVNIYDFTTYKYKSYSYNKIRLYHEDSYISQFTLNGIDGLYDTGLTPNELFNNLSLGNTLSINDPSTIYVDTFDLIRYAFSCWTNVFGIAILPNMTIGILLFLPLVIGIIVIVFKMIKK